RLDVRIEQVAGDQEQVDLLGKGQVHGRLERGELSLALGRRLLPQIVMTGAEMNVRGMDDPEHRDAACLLAGDGWSTEESAAPARLRTDGVRAAAFVRARRPHDSPLADSTVGEHCDRYVVTVASPLTSVRRRHVRPREAVADPISQPVVSSRLIGDRMGGSLVSFITRAPLAAVAVVPTRKRSAYLRAPGGRLS